MNETFFRFQKRKDSINRLKVKCKRLHFPSFQEAGVAEGDFI